MRKIYCDGACKGNPGPAGAAALLVAANYRSVELRRLKPLGVATNQIAELNAMILALEIAASLDQTATIYSDSQYALNGATEWLPNWKKNNWRTAGKKPVANVELWKTIDKLMKSLRYKPQFQWIRGHNGEKFNEIADDYANEAVTMRVSSSLSSIQAPVPAPSPVIPAHNDEIVYYELIRRVTQFSDDAPVLATAAEISCIVCEEIISGSNGSATHQICRRCGDEIIERRTSMRPISA